jgi:hypothetical protein
MKQPNSEYLVYHNGWWHGNNTVFYRYLPDTFSLVILSNRYNRSVYNVQPIFDIISGTKSNGSRFWRGVEKKRSEEILPTFSDIDNQKIILDIHLLLALCFC